MAAMGTAGNRGSGVMLPIPFDETQVTHPENRSNPQPGDPSPSLARGARPPTIAFSAKDHGGDAAEELAPTLRAGGFTTSHASGGIMPAIAFSIVPERGQGADQRMVVRRLTPLECERLQGLPDGYTAIEGASDSARYMALGNTMAEPVPRWVFRRIDLVDAALSWRPR